MSGGFRPGSDNRMQLPFHLFGKRLRQARTGTKIPSYVIRLIGGLPRFLRKQTLIMRPHFLATNACGNRINPTGDIETTRSSLKKMVQQPHAQPDTLNGNHMGEGPGVLVKAACLESL